MGVINCNTGFQPLKECWLGDCYRPEFFDYVDNTKVKNVLRQITEETIEDLENIKEVLESYGVTVKRPRVFDFDQVYNIYKVGGDAVDRNLEVDVNRVLQDMPQLQDNDGVKKYLQDYDIYENPGFLTKPPLFPRDEQVVVNDNFYILRQRDLSCLTDNKIAGPGRANVLFFETLYEEIESYKGNVINDYGVDNTTRFDFWNQGPNIVKLGDTIILDGLPNTTYKWFRNEFKDSYNIITAFNDGHSDGIYAPIKPGAFVSNGEALQFKKYFPNWDVFYLPDTQWSNMSPFLEIKDKVQGKWWIPGEEHNDELIDYVDKWFSEWVGFCEETVWDVNVLMVNPETVLCLTENEELFKWFKKHNVEPIVTPFRHRFFWDGGLHCLTLDIHREGGIESYAR
jgi:hypothetical protein